MFTSTAATITTITVWLIGAGLLFSESTPLKIKKYAVYGAIAGFAFALFVEFNNQHFWWRFIHLGHPPHKADNFWTFVLIVIYAPAVSAIPGALFGWLIGNSAGTVSAPAPQPVPNPWDKTEFHHRPEAPPGGNHPRNEEEDDDLREAREFIARIEMTNDATIIQEYADALVNHKGKDFANKLREYATVPGLRPDEERFLHALARAMEDVP